MKIGHSGLDVVKLQAQLNNLGYEVLIDGDYGQMTEAQVKRFQQKYRLSVDGWAGRNTQRKINQLTDEEWLFLFIHCSATPAGVLLTGEAVKKYHMKRKGWSRPGYSDVIQINGTLENIYPYDQDDLIGEWEYTFGVKGSTLMNKNSRHICYIGGADENGDGVDTRTKEQKETLETYVKYQLLRNPNLIIAGHNQVQRKDCPSFDVPTWLREIGVAEKNIAHWDSKFAI